MLIIDSFLDTPTRERLLADPESFPRLPADKPNISTVMNDYQDSTKPYYSPFYFWDGWWNSAENTIKKSVIRRIWENNLPCPIEDIVGFEYWTRTCETGQYHGVHIDNDTFLYEETGISNGPIAGSIYYGVDNENGGFLEIHSKLVSDGDKNVLHKGTIEKYLSEPMERERIAYKGNRLIIGDFGHLMHGTTPFNSGTRQALVVSVWTKNLPPLGISNGRFHYEKSNHNVRNKTSIVGNDTNTHEEIIVDAITPLGSERIVIKIPINKNSGPVIYENQINERYLINTYSLDGDDFMCTFSVQSPMIANIKIFMCINRSESNVHGFMCIDEYMKVELKGFIKK